jgi:hypothetical protein
MRFCVGCLPSLAAFLRLFRSSNRSQHKKSHESGSQHSWANLWKSKLYKTIFSKKSSTDSGLNLRSDSTTQMTELHRVPPHDYHNGSTSQAIGKVSTGSRDLEEGRDWADRSVLVRDEFNVTWSDANAVQPNFNRRSSTA